MSEAIDHAVLESDADDAAVKAALTPGRTVFVHGIGSAFVLDADGTVDELDPQDHLAWVDVGSLHGRPQTPDDVDIDGNDFLYSDVGRIGSIHFERIVDPSQTDWLGHFESDAAALDAAAGADFDTR